MNAELMLEVSALLFLVAALGGATMAAIRFGGKHNPPAWLAMLHGFLAAAGVTLLAYAAFAFGVPAMAQVALALFLVAAIGGAVLSLRYKWNRLLLPAWLVVLHATAAVLGFLLLLAVVLLGTDG
ncbi:hypothetical protein [Lysobacter sp. D1-1-M9]|uniref:hypothetical protein n=1 Tax=Novilysobacter longmucuonensis TaxID=3098603 RepID=UPI002FC7CAEC